MAATPPFSVTRVTALYCRHRIEKMTETTMTDAGFIAILLSLVATLLRGSIASKPSSICVKMAPK